MEKKVYAALIYDNFNVLIAMEIRPTKERAEMAGHFFTRNRGWYRVIDSSEDFDMYAAMINM